MYLVFRLAGRPFAVPAQQTLEMVHGARVSVSTLPGGHPGLLGVFDNRGSLIPIVDVRTVFGQPSFAAEVQQLRELLEARERDHVAWLTELERCAATGEPFTKATDPTKCAFGHWYDALRLDPAALSAFTGDRVALYAAVQALDTPHRSIHAIAERVLAAAAAGDREGAIRMVRDASVTHLGTLKRALRELLELFVQQRQVMLVVIQASPKNVALAVDEVVAVQDLDPEDIVPVPPAVRVSPAVAALYRPDKGEVVQILDPMAVASAVLMSPESALG